MDCFAYKKIKENGKEVFYCLALDADYCSGKACPFYKTRKQAAEDTVRSSERLRSLSSEKQKEIKKKYGLPKW